MGWCSVKVPFLRLQLSLKPVVRRQCNSVVLTRVDRMPRVVQEFSFLKLRS